MKIKNTKLLTAILVALTSFYLNAGPLHDAAENGDCKKIEQLLAPVTNEFAHELGAPFVIINDSANVQKLLYEVDEKGLTPLEYAIKNGCADATKLLLGYYDTPVSFIKVEFIISVISSEHSAALQAYISKLPIKKLFHHDVIKKIIDLGDEKLFDCFWPRSYVRHLSSTHVLPEESTEQLKFMELALYALERNQKTIAKKIINCIDFEQTMSRMLSACNSFSISAWIEKALTCVKAGITDIKSDFLFPAFWSIFHDMAHSKDYTKLIKALLEVFSFKAVKDLESGNTCLHCAAEAANIEAINIFLPLVDQNIENNNGDTSLTLLLAFKQTDEVKACVKPLINDTIRIPEKKLQWCLERAAGLGNLELLRLCIKQNPDLETKDAIDAAIRSNEANIDIVKNLIHTGGHILLEDEGLIGALGRSSRYAHSSFFVNKKQYIGTIIECQKLENMPGQKKVDATTNLLRRKLNNDSKGFNYIFGYFFHRADVPCLDLVYAVGREDKNSTMAQQNPKAYETSITDKAIEIGKYNLLARYVEQGFPVSDLQKAYDVLNKNNTNYTLAVKALLLRSCLAQGENSACKWVGQNPELASIAFRVTSDDQMTTRLPLHLIAVALNMPKLFEIAHKCNPEYMFPKKPWIEYEKFQGTGPLKVAVEKYGLDAEITKLISQIILKHHGLSKERNP